ncbi:MAG: hypothetical protein OEZ13_06490 [Spirochaetia bacterium]|nr:hypothetical protein [Spirochaetia bacterium]
MIKCHNNIEEKITGLLFWIKVPPKDDKSSKITETFDSQFADSLFWILLKNHWFSLSKLQENFRIYIGWQASKEFSPTRLKKKTKLWQNDFNPKQFIFHEKSFKDNLTNILQNIFKKEKSIFFISANEISYFPHDNLRLIESFKNDFIAPSIENPSLMKLSKTNYEKNNLNDLDYIENKKIPKKFFLKINSEKQMLKFIIFLNKKNTISAQNILKSLEELFNN